jgi:hypothetical protein
LSLRRTEAATGPATVSASGAAALRQGSVFSPVLDLSYHEENVGLRYQYEHDKTNPNEQATLGTTYINIPRNTAKYRMQVLLSVWHTRNRNQQPAICIIIPSFE